MEILLAFGVIWVISRRATIENERSKIMIGRIRGFRGTSPRQAQVGITPST